MGRLTILAKGNLDVRDSLHSLRVGGDLRWNGINEIVRERFPSMTVRVRHETLTRSDALLEARGQVPPEITARALPLGAFTAAAQFSVALFDGDADVIVLSIQPEVTSTLVRHRHDGYLLYPNEAESWAEADRRWLRDEFDALGVLDAAQSMRNLETVIERIRKRSAAPILVYNLSSVVPGDTVHCHAGLGDVLSTRIRRFNLGLAEVSQRTGISVIDVDAIVARAGAARLKLDAFHLTADGYRLVAEEVVRVLGDEGCLPAAEPPRC
jgi:hypothetical protein